MANFPPSDLLQWITRVHGARRIFQICRTTFANDRRFLPRAHPISLRPRTYVWCVSVSTFPGQRSTDLFVRRLFGRSRIILFSYIYDWIWKNRVTISFRTINHACKIFVIARRKFIYSEWRHYGLPRRFKISPNRSPNRKWQSRYVFAPIGAIKGRERREGRNSIEIVSRTIRRFDGRRVDILGRRAQQFGNLFLAGSPDRRMLDEGGVRVHSRSELGRSVPATISELIKLSRRPSVHDWIVN